MVFACLIGSAVLVYGLRAQDVLLRISGDHAPALLAQLGHPETTVGDATIDVLLLRDWGQLRYVKGAATLCGRPCAGGESHVVIHRLSLGGSGKTIFFRTGAFGEGVTACLLARTQWELSAIWPRAPMPCPDIGPRSSQMRLPWGLAYF